MKLRKDDLKAAFKEISCNQIAKMKRFFPPVNLNWERWRGMTANEKKKKRKKEGQSSETDSAGYQ